jgi:hypothetical protein
MTIDIRTIDLRKLNSLTKYPSIETYHKLGKKGLLLEEHNVEFDSTGSPIIATEKVDGTNGRIILLPNSRWIIGSREELLHAEGDIIPNPMLGIVDALRDVAERFTGALDSLGLSNAIVAAYLEVYGGNICKASKQYTSDRSMSCRLFDVSVLVPDDQTFERSLEAIAGWRQRGGQTFLVEAQLQALAQAADVQLTPRIHINRVPAFIADTHKWLQATINQSHVVLDDGAGGRPEGIVLRAQDRKAIVKLRFEDYERHARRTEKKRKGNRA